MMLKVINFIEDSFDNKENKKIKLIAFYKSLT